MKFRESLAFAATATLIITQVAWGQSAQIANADGQSADSNAAGDAADRVQEVTVTAQRRATGLLETAISVDAVSGNALAERQQNNIVDLQLTTTDMQVNSTGLYDSINIRGIGNTAITPTIQPGIAVFHDGLLSPETIFIDTPFYDITDVEVLRGPQGTLVSAASTGGAVEINSHNPDFNGVNGYAEVLLGNYSDERVDGAINLPINDTFAARVAFNVEKRGSFYSDLGSRLTPESDTFDDPGKVDQQNFRIGLLWQPNDKFSALLKAEFNYNNYGGQGGQPNPGVFPAVYNPTTGSYGSCPNPLNNPNLSVAATCQSPFYQYGTHIPFELNYALTGLKDQQSGKRVGLDLHYTLPDGIVLRSLTGWQSMESIEVDDPDISAATKTLYSYNNTAASYYSEDLSIASPTGGKLTWIAGADVFYRWNPVRTDSESYLSFPYSTDTLQEVRSGVALPGQDKIGTQIRTEGLFGNIDWNFTDTLQLDVGLRENRDRLWNRGDTFVYINGMQVANVAPSADFTDSVPTGKVGLNWTPIPGQFFYLFYARGYKPGGTQNGAPQFDPEKVNDFELGWKGRLLDDHVQVQLGGFYMKYDDMQFTGFDAETGEGSVTNIGNSTIDGIEFSTQARFGGWDLNVGLAFLHSVLGASEQVETYKLPTNLAAATPQCNGSNAADCFNYMPYETSVNGEENPYSPKFTADISIGYAFPVAGGSLRPQLSYNYTSKQYASLFQTDSYWEMGVRNIVNASLQFERDSWLAQVYLNNLTNEIYLGGIGGSAVYYGAPRQFGLRVKRSF